MRCSFLNGSLSILLSSLGSGFVVVESELYESVDFGEEIEERFVLIWLDGAVADLIVVKPVLSALVVEVETDLVLKSVLIWLDGAVADLIVVKPVLSVLVVEVETDLLLKSVLIWLDGAVADLIVVKPVLAADNVFGIVEAFIAIFVLFLVETIKEHSFSSGSILIRRDKASTFVCILPWR